MNLIKSKKRNDRKLYLDGAYVITEGYLISYEEEGPESCNCNKAKAKLKTGDVHMYIGLKEIALKINCIVVEIIPDFKKKHQDYEELLAENIRFGLPGFFYMILFMKRMRLIPVPVANLPGEKQLGKYIPLRRWENYKSGCLHHLKTLITSKSGILLPFFRLGL